VINANVMRRLLQDRCGTAVLEFALAGPAFILLLIGLFQVAVQVQNYNALRSVASDVGRFVVVEYQKDNHLSEEDIKTKALSLAVDPPYLLENVGLDIVVDSPESRVSGAKEFNIELSYDMPGWLEYAGIAAKRISYQRSVFVALS
jgi:hypothetical protein